MVRALTGSYGGESDVMVMVIGARDGKKNEAHLVKSEPF